MAAAPFDEQEYKDDLGIAALWGEKGYTTNERTGIRPTIELNGIWGGYQGEGAKTVLPSKAMAKISARLVPNQSSEIITAKLLEYFKTIAPAGVTVSAFEHHGGEPYMTPIDSIAYKAAAKAMEATFGKTPIPVRGGGSIPICALFEKELGVKIVFMGFGLDSDTFGFFIICNLQKHSNAKPPITLLPEDNWLLNNWCIRLINANPFPGLRKCRESDWDMA